MTDITIRNCPRENLLLAARAATAHLKTNHRFNRFEYGENMAFISKPIIFDTHFTKVGNLIVEYRDA
jgi:hypothetical protein